MDDAEIIARVRAVSGVPAGPEDAWIVAAARGFVEVFDYWYIRVMKKAVAKYRSVVVQRINLVVRRMQYETLDCAAFAARIVDDYNSRNFVTAGGWALEKLPPNLNPAFQKSAATGIDLERSPPGSNENHLYVLKSGLVTRNSDIVRALKQHSRTAESLLRQSNSKAHVTSNYVVAVGRTSSTFEDGVRRPSSAEFWSEVTGLPQKEAVELVLAVASEAGRMVQSDASEHIQALRTLVHAYLGTPSDPAKVDWGFLKVRLFQDKTAWAAEDKRRHKLALEALAGTGYGKAAEVAATEEEEPDAEIEELPDEVEDPGTK